MPDTALPALDARIRQRIDSRTKPQGALGRIEVLAEQIARLQRTDLPRMTGCTLILIAADHGIAQTGVSAYPQAVTGQMLANFLAGGAAANVFAGLNDVVLQVVDAGIATPPPANAGLISRRLGPGTASFLDGPAMTPEQVQAGLDQGAALAADAPGEALALGEMGIANTATAAILAHKLTGLPLDTLVGRGTGLDDAGLAHKRAVLGRAGARTDTPLPPTRAMAEYGGFEIVMMAGAMIGAGQARRVVLVDGFIATAAAALALELAPDIRPALVYAHRSAEAGHDALLGHLGAQPLLDLQMRLGEGTGALLAWPLLRAAAGMMTDMAGFSDAGVSGRP
ncbi:MAG: nicotinate-nucleotide--dimethylbenzimidazole phosphoribosyltransferase [Pararhodobacter sp.]|nr:nicotinate-nucleotide--dimethylbenzimidazole phosphoribosyltransferase [Pararhodobacter sp.]